MKKKILKEFNNHIKVSQMLPNLASEVESAAKLCIECLRQNGKILLFGKKAILCLNKQGDFLHTGMNMLYGL